MGVDILNILNSEDNKENKEETKDNKKCDFRLNVRESLKLNKIAKALRDEQKELRRGLCCSIVLVAIVIIISFVMLFKYVDNLFEVVAVLIISTTASLLLAAFIGVDIYTTKKLRLLKDILNKNSKKSVSDSVHDFLLGRDSYNELYKSELIDMLERRNIVNTYSLKEYSKLLYCANSKHRVDRIKIKKDDFGYITVKITLINKASNKEKNFEINCEKIKISDDITSITTDLHNKKIILIIPSVLLNGIKAKHIKKLDIDCKNETVSIKAEGKKKNKDNNKKEDKNNKNEENSDSNTEESLTEIEKLIQEVEEHIKEDKEEHTTKIIIPYKD